MLIGELIKRSGLTKDAIRFYEKKGLIEVDKNQRRPNNYKEYSNDVLQRLLLIKIIKNFGFTINEINTLFALWEEESNVCEVKAPFYEKLRQIDNEIERLRERREKLISSMDKCNVGQCELEKLTAPYMPSKN